MSRPFGSYLSCLALFLLLVPLALIYAPPVHGTPDAVDQEVPSELLSDGTIQIDLDRFGKHRFSVQISVREKAEWKDMHRRMVLRLHEDSGVYLRSDLAHLRTNGRSLYQFMISADHLEHVDVLYHLTDGKRYAVSYVIDVDKFLENE